MTSSSSPESPKETLLLDYYVLSTHLEKYPGFEKKAKRLRDCGTYKMGGIILCNCKPIPLIFRCNYRICDYCSKRRSYRLHDKYITFLRSRKVARSLYARGLRLLTLTIKNTKTIEEGIDKLYESLRDFRRLKYIKERLEGGLGVIEVTKGKDGLSHVHMHLIIESKYLDMKSHKKKGGDSQLVKSWKKATGDSGILDVRRIESLSGALGYVLKYITKGTKGLSEEEAAIFFKAISKHRILFTFGTFYGIKFQKIKCKCRDCGCYYQYISSSSMEYAELIEGVGKWSYAIPENPPNSLKKLLEGGDKNGSQMPKV
jgi:hypothetical protein